MEDNENFREHLTKRDIKIKRKFEFLSRNDIELFKKNLVSHFRHILYPKQYDYLFNSELTDVITENPIILIGLVEYDILLSIIKAEDPSFSEKKSTPIDLYPMEPAHKDEALTKISNELDIFWGEIYAKYTFMRAFFEKINDVSLEENTIHVYSANEDFNIEWSFKNNSENIRKCIDKFNSIRKTINGNKIVDRIKSVYNDMVDSLNFKLIDASEVLYYIYYFNLYKSISSYPSICRTISPGYVSKFRLTSDSDKYVKYEDKEKLFNEIKDKFAVILYFDFNDFLSKIKYVIRPEN